MGGTTTKSVPTTSATQQQVEIPQYIKDAGMAATSKAQDFASTPYQPFGGETVAPLTGNQTNAINLGQTSADAGKGAGDTGAALARLAGVSANDNQKVGISDLGQARDYNASSAGPVSSADISHYFNPYVQQALDPVIQNLQRSAGATQAGLASKAGMSGAFGGSRYGLEESENAKNLNSQIATTTGQGYSDAYDKAIAASQADKLRQGQSASTSISTAAGATSQANDALSRLIQASGANTSAGAGQSQLANDSINRLLTTGTVEQTQRQNQDNSNYQQYQNQQSYALQQLNALIAAAGGVPYGTSTNSNSQGTQIIQSPSILSQIAGAAGTIGGAYAASNRDWKEDFETVDEEDILKKFRNLGVESYRYKPEVREAVGDDGRKRIGPMAQDWAKEFGGNGKIIPMPEMMGTLVAAVRALERRTALAA